MCWIHISTIGKTTMFGVIELAMTTKNVEKMGETAQ